MQTLHEVVLSISQDYFFNPWITDYANKRLRGKVDLPFN